MVDQVQPLTLQVLVVLAQVYQMLLELQVKTVVHFIILVAVELADNSVDTAAFADGAVTLAKIATPTFGDADIVDDTITAASLAPNSVAASELADNSADTAAFATGAVTSAKIPDGIINAAELANDTVTDANVQDDSLTAGSLANNSVTASELADNAVDTAAIVAAKIGVM